MPFGPVGVARLDRGANVLGADAVLVQREGHELDAHRRQRAAADLHVADATDLEQLLVEDVRHLVVDLPGCLRFRSQRQDHHRGCRRIDLAIRRVRAERRGQVDARRVDRRLHVARGAVDVAAEIELQRYPGRADRARRRDFVDTGNRPEVTLQRRRDAARHRFGARAGDVRVDGYHREVDQRQRRHRQHEEAGDTGERDTCRQQRRANRAGHERARQVHASLCAAARGGESVSSGVMRRVPPPRRSNAR